MPILNTFGNGSNKSYGFTSGGPQKILLSATPGPSATISTYSGYIVFQFTATGTLNVGDGAPGTADVLLVRGGSAGTNGGPPSLPSSDAGPGGPGGNVRAVPATTITANSPIPVVVGGAATDSTFGPLSSAPGSAGGSGGSGAVIPAFGATNGGNGPTNNYLTGSPQNWAGGGGGGGAPGFPSGNGGATGGGKGAEFNARPFPQGAPFGGGGSGGAANTGGGGGGGAVALNGRGGYAGGSGVVIARFPNLLFRTS